MEDEDYAYALQLSEYANNNNDEKFSDNKPDAKKPLSVIDESWELIDPVPDIRQLFVQFNETYFDSKLACVEVKWSSRMTSCAGLCRYERRGGLCCINLSQPLLKLRPRKDLINTLLHEMIHALLFVTNNNKDRNAHGEEFHKHMYRINKHSGSKITVYHTFHDEVNVYRQHWWKCNGPCAKRHPFYGIVRRSMNRAPGPNDRWWSNHQRSCGGDFKKIKEPDKKESKKVPKKGEQNKIIKNVGSSENKITDFLKKPPGKGNNKIEINTGVSNPIKQLNNNNGSFRNNQSSASKVSSLQEIKGNSEEVFSGSSKSSSSNIHGFKMTARKNNETITKSYSGKGVKLGIGSSSSFGSRESLLKKVENDLLRNKGIKRPVEERDNILQKTKKLSKTSTAKKIENNSEKKINKDSNGKSKKPRILPNTPKNEKLFLPKSKIVPDVICIDDGTDDELLPCINESDANLVDCPACPARIPEHKLNEHLDKCLI